MLAEEQTFAQQAPVQEDISALNTSSETKTLEIEQKKESHGPIIAIVLLLIVGLAAGGLIIAYNKGLFNNKKDTNKPTENELMNNVEEPPTETFYTSDGSVVQFSDYSTVELSIKNTVNVTQSNDKMFNTLKTNPATLRFSNSTTYYSLEKNGSLLRITKYTPASNGGVGTSKEIYRETINPVDYTFENGHVGKINPSIQGYVSGNYALLEYTHGTKVGETVIMDKSFNVIQRHKHEAQNYPLATNTAIYYGVINCKGRRSSGEVGPAIETYMLNTTSGEKKYLYNIDFKNESSYCK